MLQVVDGALSESQEALMRMRELAISAGDININGIAVRSTQNIDDELSYSLKSGSALAKIKAINAIEQFTGVRAIVSATTVTGRDPIRAINLDATRWIKINGHLVSGFQVEDSDATGVLKHHINRQLTYR